MRKSSTKKRKSKDRFQNTRRKIARKLTGESRSSLPRTIALKVATGQMRDTGRFIADQFEEIRDAQVPATLRDLAERNIAQTRALYERSKDTFEAVLASWRKSFGAANQGAVALNLKIMDIADRNIDTGFDFAMNLAGAKNMADAMQLQSAYWRKQIGQLQAQAEELRALSKRVTENVTTPIESEMNRGRAEGSRRKAVRLDD
jgi:phasin